VDLLTKSSLRTQKRLDRLTISACCLALLMVGTMDGQSNPSSSTSSSSTPTDTQAAGSGTTTAPSRMPQGSTTLSPGQTGEKDISPPSTPDRYQPLATPVPAPPAPLSEFQQIVAATTGRPLPIFGTGLFNSAPSTFAPVDNIPVTPDYVIGPGDELRLQIWGQVNQRGTFVVDRTGSISLPEVGTIHVAGLQFSQLSDFLKAQLGRVYRNFDLNINLGQLRSIQVFVVGQASKPGSYTIGSLSTLLNALFASGGPLPQGSLRDIQVKRDGETITHFDLYDLLLHGDKTKDVRLQSGDVIFIPDVGPQVAVLGSVTTQAIFELRGEKTFNQVIALAGGLTNTASPSQVRVERIYNHTHRSELDVNLASGDSTPAQDGDIITVKSIIDRFQNAVTLRGNVANPGRYQWHQGMLLSDLIPDREALITRNYYLRHDLLGQESFKSNRPEDKGSPTENRSSPTENRSSPAEGALKLQSGAVADKAVDRDTVGAKGGGSAVGAALTANNGTFSATNDVILSAPDIDWNYAVIERQSPTDLTTSLLPFNLAKAIIDKDPSQDLALESGDVVTIFSKADLRVPSAQQTKFVKLEGEFVASGIYSVQPGETLHHLLQRAGGLSPDAYLYASEFTRESVRRVERQRIIEYADTLDSEITARSASLASAALTERDAAAAQESGAQARATLARLRQAQPTGRIVFQIKPDAQDIAALPDLPLEDGDRFVVPKKPVNVSVQGQVYFANAFVYEKGKRVKDYLHLAGGPDRNADKGREFVLRADGSVVSHQYANLGQRALFADRGFEDVAMLPGDTIVVPPVVERGSVLRTLTNIATIIEGFGLGAAAINILK
jgi:polysaccharide biosynthesis/export protein